MKYEKPVVLAQGCEQMAECDGNGKQCGRPCNKPGPNGGK